jgi:hypothetical protein
MQLNPSIILKQAVKAVPSIKYALGIAGLVSVIAIVQSLRVDYKIAVIGGLAILLSMSVLVIFAHASVLGPKYLIIPSLVLVYFSLFLLLATAFFLFSSVFFKWPVNLQHWLSDIKNEHNISSIGSNATVVPGLTTSQLPSPNSPSNPLPKQISSQSKNNNLKLKLQPCIPCDSEKPKQDDLERIISDLLYPPSHSDKLIRIINTKFEFSSSIDINQSADQWHWSDILHPEIQYGRYVVSFSTSNAQNTAMLVYHCEHGCWKYQVHLSRILQ